MKKRGSSLLEVIAAIVIMLIISPIVVNVVISLTGNYYEANSEAINKDRVEDCLLNLDSILRSSYLLSIKENRNKLIITMKKDHQSNVNKIKVVTINNNTLYVQTYYGSENSNLESSNVLLKDVTGFATYTKENLIYFEINTESGEKIIRCV